MLWPPQFATQDSSGGENVYAVVKIAGFQYRVTHGERIRTELLPVEVGAQVKLDRVLMVADGDQVTVGQPTVPGASVTATVVEQSKGDKIIVFDYRPGGKRHRVKAGHRQNYTWLRVDEIVAG
jgi:large subunit ribosomal protein L21